MDRITSYEIASVNSNTSITLRQAYTGGSATAANYYIIRNFAATLPAELSAQVSNLVSGYEAWKDGRVSEIAIPFDYSSLYKGVWGSGKIYKALDIVMYNTALYVCTTAHTSSNSILPTNTAYWTSYAPSMPPNIEVLNYNIAGSHNTFYRHKNLGSSITTAHLRAIKSGTFDDLYIGDYWSFTNVPYTYLDENDQEQSDIYTGNMTILHFDYFIYLGNGEYLGKHHAVIQPTSNLFSAPMNDTATAEGGYAGSKMRQKYLRRALAIFEACFGANNILTYSDYLQNAVASGRPSGGSWYDCKVELMDERHVYGGFVFDSGSPDGTHIPDRISSAYAQFAFFSIAPWWVNNRSWYWLRNIVNASHFCYVNSNGTTGQTSAVVAAGVRPFALLGSL